MKFRFFPPLIRILTSQSSLTTDPIFEVNFNIKVTMEVSHARPLYRTVQSSVLRIIINLKGMAAKATFQEKFGERFENNYNMDDRYSSFISVELYN